MELYQVRYFLAVADTLNFTRAADRCHVSQPALTKAIQKLEDTLGGLLFDRTKNAVGLTEFGQTMLPNLQQIYTTALQARDIAKRFRHNQRETIRIGIMCSIDFDLVFPAFLHFQSLHPHIDLQYSEGSMDSLGDALDKGDIDIAVMASPYDFPRRFAGPAMFLEEFVVAHPHNHRYHAQQLIALKDINAEPYCERTQCEFSVFIDHVISERGVDVDVVQQTHREDWVQAMVRAGLGISFMPESIARAGALSFVHVTDSPFARAVRALVLAERPQSPNVALLQSHLKEHVWSTRSWLKAAQ